jgi:hypothetical protein
MGGVEGGYPPLHGQGMRHRNPEIRLRMRYQVVGGVVRIGLWAACLLFQNPTSHFAILFWPAGVIGGLIVYLLKRGRSHA